MSANTAELGSWMSSNERASGRAAARTLIWCAYMLYGGTSIAPSKSAFLELQNRGYIRYDNIPLHASDGHSVDVEFVSNIYEVDGKRVIQCNIRDIRVRREMEEQTRELGAKLGAAGVSAHG